MTTDYAVDATLNSLAQLAADKVVASGQSGAASVFGQSYAGIAITPGGVELSLAGDNAPDVEAVVPRVVDSVPVTFKIVDHSQAVLNALTDRIGADRNAWIAEGITLSAWGPDYSSNKVLIYLSSFSKSAADALAAKYGTDLTIVSGDSVQYSPASRTTDTTPWYGGDLITTSAACTSWFSTSNASGQIFGLTAGHCGGGTWYTNGLVYGTTYSIAYPNFNIDAEVIPVSSNAGYIWADPNFSTRRVSAYSTTDPVGGLICTDGATDREVCNVRIDQANVTDCYSGQCTSGSVLAHQLNGVHAFSGGDSGGPVETTLGDGTTEARGMIIANRSSDPSYGAYSPVVAICNQWGLALKTS